jgi:hypothetical protein
MFLNGTVADDLKAMKRGLRIFLTMRVGRVVSCQPYLTTIESGE